MTGTMSVHARRMFIIIWLFSKGSIVTGCYYKRVFHSLDLEIQTTDINVKNKILNSEECALLSSSISGLAFSFDKIQGVCKVYCQMLTVSGIGNALGVSYYNRQYCEISQCACGWIRLESYCFYVSKDTRSWQEARAECVKTGGHLASVLNEHINELVISLLKPAGNRIGIWLGGNSLINKTWLWEFKNEHLSYENWHKTHPGTGKGDCMKIMSARHSRWKWYADFCDLEKRFLCQGTPTRYTKDEF